jgi:hypothetical protein
MEELKFILAGLLLLIGRVAFVLVIAGGLLFAANRLWRRWQRRTAESPGSGPAEPPASL